MPVEKNESVKIALSGCGAVSRLYYAPALQEIEACGKARVVAVCDPSAGATQHLQKTFPHAAAFTDLSELDVRSFDLGIVASPHSMHARQVIHLLKHGKSVLCEKPMATSVADAQTMADAAASSSGLLAVGMVRRFFPATATVRRILELGMLGDIRSFQFAEGDANFNWPVASPAYFKKDHAHGGVLMDIGVHALDLLLWWFGEPLELTYEDDAMGGIEVNCRVRCVYENFSGEISLSRDCALANRYTIRGSKGWLSWRVNEAEGLEIGFEDARYGLDAKLRFMEESGRQAQLREQAFNFEQSFVSQLQNVIETLRGRETLRVDGAEGMRSLRLIERCYRRRSLLPMGWLDESESSRAQALHAANPPR